MNLSRTNKFWDQAPMEMERIEEFAEELQEGEHMISFDLVAGYRHVYLHPDMIDFFIFRYEGEYYQCLALPFGWVRSAYHFCRFLAPAVTHLRVVLEKRTLWYLDDFLVAPGRSGRPATAEDCLRASRIIDAFLLRLELERHLIKGVWGSGTQELEHLGFFISTVATEFTVNQAK